MSDLLLLVRISQHDLEVTAQYGLHLTSRHRRRKTDCSGVRVELVCGRHKHSLRLSIRGDLVRTGGEAGVTASLSSDAWDAALRPSYKAITPTQPPHHFLLPAALIITNKSSRVYTCDLQDCRRLVGASVFVHCCYLKGHLERCFLSWLS